MHAYMSWQNANEITVGDDEVGGFARFLPKATADGPAPLPNAVIRFLKSRGRGDDDAEKDRGRDSGRGPGRPPKRPHSSSPSMEKPSKPEKKKKSRQRSKSSESNDPRTKLPKAGETMNQESTKTKLNI